ncbi:hypothetical protein [Luteimonas yindakuii]|nr:hypothetical protein [Luteimonas yindakuii]
MLKFRREGTVVEVTGMDAASATLVERHGEHDRHAVQRLMGPH